MDSKEFGLVAAQQLFNIEDLHYGFWDKDDEVSLSTWQVAQEKHTKFLFDYIDKYIKNKNIDRLLDIGCGVGITTKKLLENKYNVDGLVPYQWMADYAKNITYKYKTDIKGHIYDCKFENIPIEDNIKKYDIAFFSESFQYVNMEESFSILNQILKPEGIIIIFDFFKKDDIEGKSPLGGGHSIGSFYKLVKQFGYNIVDDKDVTKNLSPNLKLVNDFIVDRFIPFSSTLNKFMLSRYKTFYKIFKWLLRKKIDKLSFKYSADRNEENFIKYKTYRLITLVKKN